MIIRIADLVFNLFVWFVWFVVLIAICFPQISLCVRRRFAVQESFARPRGDIALEVPP
jgi:uncharacterized membrane protein YhaH (DUF805 family)